MRGEGVRVTFYLLPESNGAGQWHCRSVPSWQQYPGLSMVQHRVLSQLPPGLHRSSYGRLALNPASREASSGVTSSHPPLGTLLCTGHCTNSRSQPRMRPKDIPPLGSEMQQCSLPSNPRNTDALATMNPSAALDLRLSGCLRLSLFASHPSPAQNTEGWLGFQCQPFYIIHASLRLPGGTWPRGPALPGKIRS